MPGALRGQLRQGRVQAPRDSPLEHTAEGGQLGPGQGVRGNQLVLSWQLTPGNGALGKDWPGRPISANEAES